MDFIWRDELRFIPFNQAQEIFDLVVKFAAIFFYINSMLHCILPETTCSPEAETNSVHLAIHSSKKAKAVLVSETKLLSSINLTNICVLTNVV